LENAANNRTPGQKALLRAQPVGRAAEATGGP
jgi:hypothetical protein